MSPTSGQSKKPKRTAVIFDESGKKLYQGEDRRLYGEDYTPKIFGMSFMDTIKIVLYIVGATSFFMTIKFEINNMKEIQIQQNIILTKLVQWTENSDNWNSAQFGTTFKDGKPLNDRYSEWNKTQLRNHK